MAPSTLVLLAHPALERSRANRVLVDGIADLEGVTIHDLYEEYPDFVVDVEREQALLERHDRLVWQHPLYWYSTPALLKEWFDVVLEYGWAYGEGGRALHGKSARSVVTAGGSRDAYGPEGYNRYTVEEFLHPVERTAALCGMSYAPPLVFYGALHLDEAALRDAVQCYRELLQRP